MRHLKLVLVFRIVGLIIYLLHLGFHDCVSAGTHYHNQHTRQSSSSNPYTVLGVDAQTATSDEIKRQYRRLCLEYHPDKKHHLPVKDRLEYERKFKALQSAYELIGTPEARQKYDSQCRANSFSNGYRQWFNSNEMPRTYESDIRRAFTEAFRSSNGNKAPSFFDSNPNLYRTTRRSTFGRGAMPTPMGNWESNPTYQPPWLQSTWKSIYVQSVTIPLEDLYTGRPNYEFHVCDNVWTRVVAAFRGRIAFVLLYRSLLGGIPMMFISRKFSIVWSFFLFFSHLPSISRSSSGNIFHFMTDNARDEDRDDSLFMANLQPGYKANTKLIFNDERTGKRGVEVHFVLKEGRHPIYTRIGNNLHVSCTISPKQAATGCQIEIPSLHDPDFKLIVSIPRHVSSGDRIVIPEKGWPNRKLKGAKGDLVVTVVVSSGWKEARRRSSV